MHKSQRYSITTYTVRELGTTISRLEAVMLCSRVLTSFIRDKWEANRFIFTILLSFYLFLAELYIYIQASSAVYLCGCFQRIIVFLCHYCNTSASYNQPLVQRFFTPAFSTPSGGDLRDGDPANEIPRVAAVRLLPRAGVGLQASDGGHAGREAFRHCRGSGPCDRYMCQQHCTLPTTVQQDGDVSDAATHQHWIVKT